VRRDFRFLSAFVYAGIFACGAFSNAAQADAITIRNFSGTDIGTTPQTLTGTTSEAGTTQVIRVGVDGTIAGGDNVEITVAGDKSFAEVVVLSDDGSALIGNKFTLTSASSEKILIIKGVDDETQDGSVAEILNFEVTARVGTVVSLGIEYDLTVNNSDNDGTSASTAPSEPTQRYPLTNANFATDENFLWEHAYDREGNNLTYQLCVRADGEDIAKCVSVDDDSLVPGSGVAKVSWPLALAILSMMALFKFGRRKKRRTATHIIQFAPQVRRKAPSGAILVFLLFILTAACGNQALIDALQVSPRPSVKSTFPDLLENTDYYWRVYADDGAGNVVPTSSEIKFKAVAP